MRTGNLTIGTDSVDLKECQPTRTVFLYDWNEVMPFRMCVYLLPLSPENFELAQPDFSGLNQTDFPELNQTDFPRFNPIFMGSISPIFLRWFTRFSRVESIGIFLSWMNPVFLGWMNPISLGWIHPIFLVINKKRKCVCCEWVTHDRGPTPATFE